MWIPLLLLWFTATPVRGSEECPDISTLFVQADCESESYCEAPSSDGKSIVCSPDLTMEGREGQAAPWEEIDEVKCKDKVTISTRKKYKTKNLDYTNFRCIGPACSVTAPTFTYCPPRDTCVEATVKPSQFTCPANSALEGFKKADERWIEISHTRCIGPKLSSEDFKGGPMEEYRCRTLRNCDLDKYEAKCDVRDNCAKPTVAYHCSRSTLKASFTKDVEWKNITPTSIICERNQLKDGKTKHLIMALSCVRKAVCDVKIDIVYENSCEDDDVCSKPKLKSDSRETKFVCGADAIMEYHTGPNEPWKLRESIDCYNEDFFEPSDLSKFDGNLRCRSKRGNNMTKYFKKIECDPAKTCSKPVSTTGTLYNCNIDRFTTWIFQGKLTTNWIEIVSAEFRNEVFVMKKTDGEDPQIPMQFRCMRPATCEVDLFKRFNITGVCPKDDTCKKAEYSIPKEQEISCNTKEMALEFQSIDKQPWKELWKEENKIGCINQEMTPASTVYKNIRCRSMRKCDMKKYYFAVNVNVDVNSDCLKSVLCEEPTPSASPKCSDNYVPQFKAFDDGPWLNIDRIECKDDRYKPISSDAVHNDAVPVGFRCVLEKKCDLKYYYNETDCEVDQICAKPISKPPVDSSYKLKCDDPIMALRAKFASGHWKEVSIECKENKEFVLKDNGSLYDDFPLRIQCVKLTVTTCLNPCPNCGGVKFFPPKNWKDAARFFCKNPGQFMIIGRSSADQRYTDPLTCMSEKKNGTTDVDMWESKNPKFSHCLTSDCLAGKAIQCTDITMCSQKTPLVSLCNSTESKCGRLSVTDFYPLTCPNMMVLRNITTGQQTLGKALECNLQDGTWKFTLPDGTWKQIVDEDANVVCEYPDCDMSRIYPAVNTLDCNPQFHHCVPPIVRNDIYQCPDDHKFYYRLNPESEHWRSDKHFYSGMFKCCQGEIGQLVTITGMPEEEYSCFGDFQPIDSLIDRLQVKCAKTPNCNEAIPLVSDCNEAAHCLEFDFSDTTLLLTCAKGKYKRVFHINGEASPEFDNMFCDTDSSTWVLDGEERFPLSPHDNVVCAPNGVHFASTRVLLLAMMALLCLA